MGALVSTGNSPFLVEASVINGEVVKLDLLVVNDWPPMSVSTEGAGDGPEVKNVEESVTITVFEGGELWVEASIDEEARLFQDDDAGVDPVWAVGQSTVACDLLINSELAVLLSTISVT